MKENPWPLVQLGEVLTHRKEFIQIDDLRRYKRCRVKLHSQGVVLRDEIEGALIKTKKQQVCRYNEFLVAEIDAKMGGFGLVPQALDDAIVSSHYFLFAAKPKLLDVRFLGFYARTPAFRGQVSSRGTTNYAAIRPANVLDYTIPLPSLEEQKRIVSRIDGLVGKIEEAQTLHDQLETKSWALLRSVFSQLTANVERRRMEVVAPLVRRPADISPASRFPQVSVRSFGKGTFHNPPLLGHEITWQKPHLVLENDILVSNSKAWEGAIAVAGPEDNNRFGSHRYLTFVANPEIATPEFVAFYLLSPQGLFQVGEASPGSADRNRTLRSRKMLDIEVPLPPIEEQQRFGELLQKSKCVKHNRQTTLKKLNALLPSILDRAFKGEL